MTHKLDLLLVNPGNRRQMYAGLGTLLSAVEPPLWAALLAAFIRQRGFSVKIIDADAEGLSPEDAAGLIIKESPLLTAIAAIGANPSASSTPKMPSAGALVRALKKLSCNIKTFMYGIHPSALTEETFAEFPVDFIGRGECFYILLELLGALKASDKSRFRRIAGLWYRDGDKIIPNGWGRLAENLDELPYAAWDLLPMDKYRAHNWHCFGHIGKRGQYAVIYTSLGCPFNCAYCNIHALYDGKPGIRFRSPKKVVEEIDLLVTNYNVKNVKILDELFILKEERVNEFCELLIQRRYDLNIWAYARVDTVNERILKKLKSAGVNWLAYGIESASKRVRDGVRKGGFGQDAIRRAVEMTHKEGIHVVANIIFGLPDDDLNTMRETLALAEELNCAYANLYVAMAYPGSRLYEDAKNKGMRLPESWAGYSQFSEETLPLPTKYLSGAEVLRFRDSAFEEYYSRPEYIEMIKEKFGITAVEHIKQMLTQKIKRKYA